MAILLIAISFSATIAIFYYADRSPSNCLRVAFLKSSILQAVIITITTEIFSIYKSLAFEFVASFWGLFALLNCAIAIILLYHDRTRIDVDRIKQEFGNRVDNLRFSDRIAVTAVSLILLTCLLTALIAPPNNYDSMTYHLPRVMHWMQNRTVAHYPTNNLRQISFPPGASYIVTHLQILAGSDRFANLVQWLAFVGSIFASSLIAKIFGSDRSQAITGLICASIPMAIVQSTTTQTDLIVSFWLICFAYFIWRTANYSQFDLFWLSASFGLAVLTKPTGIIFGTPLIVILIFRSLGTFRDFSSYPQRIFNTSIFTLTFLALSTSLSMPNYWRNYQTFYDFLGDDFGTRNETIGLIPLISNLLRNLALNIPIVPFWQAIEKFHKYVLGIDPNHGSITYTGTLFNTIFTWVTLTPNEDFAANPIHLMLGVISIIVLAISYSLTKKRQLLNILSLAMAIIIGFLGFCLLIKWQIWGNRLMLPVFILGSPLIGYFVSSYLLKRIQQSLLYLLTTIAIIYSLTSVYHPLIPLPRSWTNVNLPESILFAKRTDLYFRGNAQQKEIYNNFVRQAIDKNNCNRIALSIGKDDPEYPIWVMIADESLEAFKIKHINVNNPSRNLPEEFPNSEICAIFTTN